MTQLAAAFTARRRSLPLSTADFGAQVAIASGERHRGIDRPARPVDEEFLAVARQLGLPLPAADFAPPIGTEVLATDGHLHLFAERAAAGRWLSNGVPLPDNHVIYWWPLPEIPNLPQS